MNDPNNFIVSTDFATIKNDDSDNTLSVTIPSSVVVAANSIYTQTSVVTVGSVASNIRARIQSSKDGRWVVGNSLSISRIRGDVIGFYDIFVTVTRESATQVRLTAFIRNGTTGSLTGEAGSETFNAEVSTFLSPFV